MLPGELRYEYEEIFYGGDGRGGGVGESGADGNAGDGVNVGDGAISGNNAGCDAEGGAVGGEHTDIRMLVKAADTICAYIKCLEELAGGNTEFAAAAKSTRRKLDTIELPEVRKFICDYIDAFSLSLDEYGI